MRLLFAEDDAALRGVLADRLRQDGFAVDEANGLAGAEDAWRVHAYDCFILDRLLPDGDAVERLSEWRQAGTATPTLILTAARRDVHDRLDGFAAGADDYLVKPFDNRELVARVRALCRRAGVIRPGRIQRGDLVVDRAAREVWRNGVLVPLTRKELAMLEVLAAVPEGVVVSREEIIEHCWDEYAEPFSNAVNVHLASLRRKLGAPSPIKTVWGRGYRLVSEPAS